MAHPLPVGTVLMLPLKDLVECLECPICREAKTLIISKACGHRCCQECFTRMQPSLAERGGDAKKTEPRCPVCREVYATRRQAVPDVAFNDLVKLILGPKSLREASAQAYEDHAEAVAQLMQRSATRTAELLATAQAQRGSTARGPGGTPKGKVTGGSSGGAASSSGRGSPEEHAASPGTLSRLRSGGGTGSSSSSSLFAPSEAAMRRALLSQAAANTDVGGSGRRGSVSAFFSSEDEEEGGGSGAEEGGGGGEGWMSLSAAAAAAGAGAGRGGRGGRVAGSSSGGGAGGRRKDAGSSEAGVTAASAAAIGANGIAERRRALSATGTARGSSGSSSSVSLPPLASMSPAELAVTSVVIELRRLPEERFLTDLACPYVRLPVTTPLCRLFQYVVARHLHLAWKMGYGARPPLPPSTLVPAQGEEDDGSSGGGGSAPVLARRGAAAALQGMDLATGRGVKLAIQQKEGTQVLFRSETLSLFDVLSSLTGEDTPFRRSAVFTVLYGCEGDAAKRA